MDTKKLRQKILDLAIRGKLVPQEPNDEPAIELMRRINPRFEPYCEEKCQIEIPNNWIVCHLGDLYNIVSAKRVHKSEWKHSGIPFYRAREIAKLATEGYVNNELYISETHYEEMKLNYGVPNPTDIMMSAVGTIGKTYIVKEKDVFYYKDASVLCLKNINNLYSPYISLLLSSEFLQNQMFEKSKGTTVDTITIEKAKSYRILLPPLSEQKRIVSAIEQWFALIDILENEKSDLQASLLQAKSKILDLAIHGKLVPQDPNDEPAIELLKHINPKFEACENVVDNDLPNGWVFCRLEDIVDYEQPQAYIVQSTEYSPKYKTPVLTAGKSFIIGYTNEEKGICSNLPVIIFDDFTTESKYVDFPFKVKSSAMKILHANKDINIQYVYYFMSITRLIGDTHKRYWISEYSKIAIPLPPYKEQLRIVAKIEELFAIFDSIKESLA